MYWVFDGLLSQLLFALHPLVLFIAMCRGLMSRGWCNRVYCIHVPGHDPITFSLMMMSWCLMSSDVIWHIRDKLWPMPKHGSIKSTYVRCMRVLAVTCHLHFWQNDRDFLRATAVTRGWNGYRNKSQHRKSNLEKKILPPFQQGFEPATFQSRVPFLSGPFPFWLGGGFMAPII